MDIETTISIISSAKKPFKKLQAQKGESATNKVGSWLGGSTSNNMAEAYDSDSDSSSSSVSPSTIKQAAAVNGGMEDDSDNGESEREVEEQLDWDTVMTKLRSAITDRSKTRRATFISRYLTVTESCTSADL